MCDNKQGRRPGDNYHFSTHSSISDHGLIHLVPVILLFHQVCIDPVAVQNVDQLPSAALKVQVHYQLGIQVAPIYCGQVRARLQSDAVGRIIERWGWEEGGIIGGRRLCVCLWGGGGEGGHRGGVL